MPKKRIPPKLHFGERVERVEKPKPQPPRAVVKYWEDPVYGYLSVLKRKAESSGNLRRSQSISGLMQQIIDNRMRENIYAKLLKARKSLKQEIKRERQKTQKPVIRPEKQAVDPDAIKRLKATVFNYQASLANVIKAFEALPEKERKEIVEKAPPYLRKRLASYWKEKGYL